MYNIYIKISMQFMLNVAQTSGIGRRHVRKVCYSAVFVRSCDLQCLIAIFIHSSCYTFVARRKSTVSQGTCTLWGTIWRPSRIFARLTPRTPPGCPCIWTTRWRWGSSINWRLVMRLPPQGLATGRHSATLRKVMEGKKACYLYLP